MTPQQARRLGWYIQPHTERTVDRSRRKWRTIKSVVAYKPGKPSVQGESKDDVLAMIEEVEG
jgi:hypothetical protein